MFPRRVKLRICVILADDVLQCPEGHMIWGLAVDCGDTLAQRATSAEKPRISAVKRLVVIRNPLAAIARKRGRRLIDIKVGGGHSQITSQNC